MAVSNIKYKLFLLLLLFIILYSVYYYNLDTKYQVDKGNDHLQY